MFKKLNFEIGIVFTISVEKIGKRFNREWIFRNFTFTFESGNVYAITGPNGSGKSTLLQVLWGQTPQSAGNLNYAKDGNPISMENVYKHLSIAAPYMDLIEEFTLEEQIRFHFSMKKALNNLSPAKLMDIMALSHAKDKYIGNFSSGMKQRLKLGLAFFTESDILFLDEPGTNLDKQAFTWYLDHLHQVSGERLVIIASNHPQEYPSSAIEIDVMTLK